MLKKNWFNRLWIFIIAGIFCLQVFAAPQKPSANSGTDKLMGETVTTIDLLKAVRLVEASNNIPNVNFSEYRLVNAQQLLSGSKHCSSLRCWKLTYKQAHLIPNQITDIIGAGGEMFFIVNLDNDKVIFIGYGE